MDYVLGFALCLALTAGVWLGALALEQRWLLGEDLRCHPNFLSLSSVPLLMVSGLLFAPWPWGYVLSLPLWWLTAKGIFQLPWGRAIALFVIVGVLFGLLWLGLMGLVALS